MKTYDGRLRLPIIGLTLAAIIAGSVSVSLIFAAAPTKLETSATPEVVRSVPLPATSTRSTRAATLQVAPATATSNLGPNLIANPSLESTDASGLPTGWSKGGYGTNTRTYAYPVSGANGTAKGAQVSISSYTSGDAKWYPNGISITGGHSYQFSDYSLSNVPSIVDIDYTLSDGTHMYKDIASVPASASYQNTTVQFTAPSNAVSLTVFHLIEQAGTITTDEYALNEITVASGGSNLVANGNLEMGGTNAPQGFSQGGWGTNTRSFAYPVTGVSGSKAAQVSVSSYTSGDAKWYFDPIALGAGIYTYSDAYQSNIPSEIDVQFHNADGSYTYKKLADVSAAGSFATESFDFSVAANVADVTVFHLIAGVGTLAIDNVSVTKKGDMTGVFTTGAISLTFDDGLISQYNVAVPKLNSAGLKGTFFIVTHQMADNGFPGFMSVAQVQSLSAAGHEIGAHTRTHPMLTSLTQAQQTDEISGSRQDLLAMNVGSVPSFAYPYGDYNSTTIQVVKDAGFASARATIDGNVVPTSDRYQLPRFSMNANVTFAQAKQQIDTAIANKQWIILTFHDIDTSGSTYSTTPTIFNQVIDYLVSKGAPVITQSQGIGSLQ